MSDLIRREDAYAAIRGLTRHIDRIAAITALPAVQPDLTDPVVVHANMVRGTIAKPTLDQIIHLYGVDALCRALVPVISREAAFAAPHVNETPKSEHDARDVLTPATKGGAHD